MSASTAITIAVRQLTGVSPLFREGLDSLIREWYPDTPPQILQFSAIGRRVAEVAVRLTESEHTVFWTVVEKVLTTGTQDVRDAICTGLLEAVLNETSSGRFDPKYYVGRLGPESMKYCKAWNDFTGCAVEGIE